MKRARNLRNFLAGVLTTVLVLALVVPAGAALTGKTIQVLTGVDIYVDGVEMKPTDATGKPVETFVYNGTTYVPLRAVSQSLGKNVKWDGANRRVYIGEVPGEKQYLLSVCPPYQTDGYKAPSTFTMAGQKYANGLTIDHGYALFNLNGQYDTMSFTIGCIDDASRYFGDKGTSSYDIFLDGELIFSMNVNLEMMPQKFEIPLNGALQMKITNEFDTYGMVDIQVY